MRIAWFAKGAGIGKTGALPAGLTPVDAENVVRAEMPAPAHYPLVRLSAVSKTFETGGFAVKALDDVSLTIEANEFFTLLGPSGCGKSTLLRMLAGFEHPATGAVFIDGRDVSIDPPNRRPVNIVFQSYALFPHMTVAQNIAFGLEQLGHGKRETKVKVEAMLRLVRLEGYGSRFPAQLSGGQQQRVALARALAPAPRLLLLDEPMSALDVKLRREMQIELKRIQRETGITFLLVTHDQDEALSLSSRIAVMHGGRVMQTGTPSDIFERPANPFVARFMGWNVMPGAFFGIDAPFVAIRPEQIELSEGNGEGPGGRIVDTHYFGSRISCRVLLDAGAEIEAGLAAGRRFEPGRRVTCHIPAPAFVELGA